MIAEQTPMGRLERGDELRGWLGQPGVIPGDARRQRLAGGVEQQGGGAVRVHTDTADCCGVRGQLADRGGDAGSPGRRVGPPGPGSARQRVRNPGPGDDRAVRGEDHRLGGRGADVDSEVGHRSGVLRFPCHRNPPPSRVACGSGRFYGCGSRQSSSFAATSGLSPPWMTALSAATILPGSVACQMFRPAVIPCAPASTTEAACLSTSRPAHTG